MDSIGDESIELVVTSPPYPMIEMWDPLFGSFDPSIETAISEGDDTAAFERMHAMLDAVWDELERVLVDGGVACINIGDATRTFDGQFGVYPNHARIIDAFEARGFTPLPSILWRKPANSVAKFMGSGMLPPNAYVTHEHEHLLVFRKGSRRSFEPGAAQRYESAYFWEERNQWFSDLWTDVNGTWQDLEGSALRDRSGAYPLAIPYRLICMYSVYSDTVLDPFAGTGTTSLAAMIAGRHSIGFEIDAELADVARSVSRDDLISLSKEVVSSRIQDHQDFVRERLAAGKTPEYTSTIYGFPVITSQEQQIQFYLPNELDTDENHVHISYDPFLAAMIDQ